MTTNIDEITQSISPISQAGHRGVDARTLFVTKQEAFQDDLTDTFVGEINTLKDQQNTAIGQMNTLASEVETLADNASQSATEASDSAVLSQDYSLDSKNYRDETANIIAMLPSGAINDSTTASNSTWSSQKINNELSLADTTKAFITKGFILNEEYTLALNKPTNGAIIGVQKEVPQNNIVNNTWITDSNQFSQKSTNLSISNNSIALYNSRGSIVSETVFNSASTSYISTTTLSNGNALIAYLDGGNSNYGTFVIVDSSGSTVVSKTVFNSASTIFISATALSNGNVLIAYQDIGNSNYGTFVIVDSSGSTVVSKTVFNSASTIFISATALSNGNVLIAYQDIGNSNYGTFVIVDSSGSTVVSKTVFNSANTSDISATALSNGNVLIAYINSGIKFVIVDSSGSIVVSETTINPFNANNGHISATALSNGNALIAYRDGGNSNYGTFVIVDSSGGTVVSETVFNSARTDGISTKALTNGDILIAYTDYGNSNYGTFLTVSTSGTTVVSETVFNSASTSHISATTSGMICYREVTSGNLQRPSALVYFDYTDNEYISAVSTAPISTEFWTDINSTTATETLNSQSIYYSFSSDGKETFKIAKTTLGERNIVRNNGGIWEYNSNATYNLETWTPATTNDIYTAIQESTALSINQLTSTDLTALTDAEQITLGDTLDMSVTLFTNSDTATPIFKTMSINYDTFSKWEEATPNTDYKVWQDGMFYEDVKVKALVANNFKIRVV